MSARHEHEMECECVLACGVGCVAVYTRIDGGYVLWCFIGVRAVLMIHI